MQVDPLATPGDSTSIVHILADLVHHPYSRLLRRWNWKSALFSTIMRGSIFFSVNLLGSLAAAVSALTTELIFRPFMSGLCGSFIESLRRATPRWAGSLVVAVAVPVVNHTVELAIHWARGTQKLGASVLVSVSFSALSGVFNIFAMRRGVLIVGEGRSSLVEDLRRIPKVIAAFVIVAPVTAWKLISKLRWEQGSDGR